MNVYIQFALWLARPRFHRCHLCEVFEEIVNRGQSIVEFDLGLVAGQVNLLNLQSHLPRQRRHFSHSQSTFFILLNRVTNICHRNGV